MNLSLYTNGVRAFWTDCNSNCHYTHWFWVGLYNGKTSDVRFDAARFWTGLLVLHLLGC